MVIIGHLEGEEEKLYGNIPGDVHNIVRQYILILNGAYKGEFTCDNAGKLLKDDKAKYTYDVLIRTEKVETFDGRVQINH
ncbi:MAG: hypothetical protein K2K74_06270 [Lachnospiraceae bacterium]|nr:hypothetical protein [Lachnospiraceae bacterium]